jgi:nucleotidyltransferase substrate binding protein (TIGR01987 family)
VADRASALHNLSRGLAQLEAFAALPIENERDKAGVIQAFAFTFELFWKYFQKVAPEAGLSASTPREALQAGLLLGLIVDAESAAWSLMLRDRNLSSHTYNEPVAAEILRHVLEQYLPCFRLTMARLAAVSGTVP